MIAGSGATFEESFGIPTWLGALIMTVVIYLTLLLDFNKIVRALGRYTILDCHGSSYCYIIYLLEVSLSVKLIAQ